MFGISRGHRLKFQLTRLREARQLTAAFANTINCFN